LQGAINAGTRTVTLLTKTASRPINLGSEVAGSLSLTEAELDRITAGTLVIGRNDATASGAITVSAANLGPNNVTANFDLLPGGGVGVTGAGSILFDGAGKGLRIVAGNAINLPNANDVTTLAASTSNAAQGITFTDSDALAVGTVDGTVGVT